MAKPLTFNFEGGFQFQNIDCPSDICCIEYCELYENLLVGCMDGAIRVYDLKTKDCTMTLNDPDCTGFNVTSMKHRPVSKSYPITNSFIVSYSNGTIKCWNYNHQQSTFSLTENRNTTAVAYHPKLAKFITIGDNKKIYMYDEDSQRQERVLTSSGDKTSKDGHSASITAICFHPKSPHELITCGLDNLILFWDTRQPHALGYIEGVCVQGEGLSFSSSGKEFISCSTTKPGPLRIWDYTARKEIKIIETDKLKNVPLRCGTYLNKNIIVCGGGEPQFLRIVDLDKCQNLGLMTNYPKPISNNITVGPIDSADRIPKFAFGSGTKIYEVSPK